MCNFYLFINSLHRNFFGDLDSNRESIQYNEKAVREIDTRTEKCHGIIPSRQCPGDLAAVYVHVSASCRCQKSVSTIFICILKYTYLNPLPLSPPFSLSPPPLVISHVISCYVIISPLGHSSVIEKYSVIYVYMLVSISRCHMAATCMALHQYHWSRTYS